MRVDYAKLVSGVFRGQFVAALLPLLALSLVQTKALSAEDDQHRRQDKNDPRWSVMIFGGTSAEADRFLELMAAPWVGTYGVNNFVGAAFSSRFYRVGNFTFEGEVGAGYRFKDFSSSELWGALYVRYDGFPWNHLVYTTFAANTGLSYAEKVPPVELHSCSGRGNPNCWNLLHYFSPEVTFANPNNPNLEMVIRWHHRSGAYGLMNGTWGGSNILTAGIRARFSADAGYPLCLSATPVRRTSACGSERTSSHMRLTISARSWRVRAACIAGLPVWLKEIDVAQAYKKAWFQELRTEFEKLAASSDFFEEELKLLDERQRFSIYSDCNPIWLMDYSERAGIYMLLGLSRPQVVIEIGTRFAGSTSLFSDLSEYVYVVDIDPEVERRCKPLANVTVLIGDSSVIIPSLIDRLNEEHGGWDFALVDGDHSSAGVRNDLNALIANRPKRHAYVAMQDSFNPECRKGILEANWQLLPRVHNVEIDFWPRGPSWLS